MVIQISNLKQEVNNLKHKSELILPTTGNDPSYEKFQPPDPPDSIQTRPDVKQPPDDPRRTYHDLATPPASHVSCASHVPVSPKPISAHIQKLINQGFNYAPGQTFKFFPESEAEEEEEDQSITTMDEPKWRSPPKDTQN